MSKGQMNLLQGTLDVLVLKALDVESRHGYGVASWVRHVTGGTLRIEDGALYTSLHRMEKRGWIRSEWGVSESNRGAKYYELTARGRAELRKASTDWERYASAVSKVLQSEGGR
jgi:transcriptional regulator